jgi:PsbN protein
MDNTAFFSIIFIGCFLLSMTGYSIYVGFGPPSNDLRDPFEEHED